MSCVGRLASQCRGERISGLSWLLPGVELTFQDQLLVVPGRKPRQGHVENRQMR